MTNCNCTEQDRTLQLEWLAKFMHMRCTMERVVSPVFQKYRLTPSLAITLNLIAHQQSPTVSMVFRTLELNQGNVSSMCKKLEAEGFLLRRRSKEDERSVVLEITQAGRTALEQIERELSHIGEQCQRIPAEDLHAAAAGIDALARLAEKIEHAIVHEREVTHNA